MLPPCAQAAARTLMHLAAVAQQQQLPPSPPLACAALQQAGRALEAGFVPVAWHATLDMQVCVCMYVCECVCNVVRVCVCFQCCACEERDATLKTHNARVGCEVCEGPVYGCKASV